MREVLVVAPAEDAGKQEPGGGQERLSDQYGFHSGPGRSRVRQQHEKAPSLYERDAQEPSREADVCRMARVFPEREKP